MSHADAVAHAVASLGPLAQRDIPIGPMTTYRVGGAAAVFVEIQRDDDFDAVSRARRESGLPILVVGKGSNLLVADAGFGGIAVVLGPAFEHVTIAGAHVRAGAAAGLPQVARRSAAAGLTGLEWTVGIPGSVGGGVRMNAGGHGSDMASVLVEFQMVDLAGGSIGTFGVGRLDYGYRRSALTADQVVIQASLRAEPGDRTTAEAQIAEIVRWRRDNQPGGRNAGSVFTNPPRDSAGRLVEAAGLKGLRRRTARVSPKHANFIQCDDGGSADDVFALLGEVAATVERRLGVRLSTEIHLVGFPGTYPHAVGRADHGAQR